MENFLCTDNSVTLSPESLAWSLLMNSDNIDDFGGVIRSFVDDDTENIDMSDKLAGEFEILITIYMEMIMGYLKIEHITKLLNENDDLDEDVNPEDSFKPDYTLYSMDDLKDFFQAKFTKIRYLISVQEINSDVDKSDSRDFGLDNKYYCRIILKDTVYGKTYFWSNRQRLDPNKRYTFVIRNEEYKNNKKLEDYYAVCCLPHMKFRIHFTPINVIVKDTHLQ